MLRPVINPLPASSPSSHPVFAALLLMVASLVITGAASAADFTVRAESPDLAYTINGVGGSPPLTLVRGQTYTFDVNACPCHPFQIVGAPAGSVVNNNIASGTLVFAVPLDAVNYTYICSIHRFGGTITSAPPPSPPSVSTVSASSVGSTSATLNASINPNGQATTASFVYGTDPTLATGALGTTGETIGNGITSQAFTTGINGLQPGTTYYFRAKASSSGGTVLGGILSFPTLSNDATLSSLVLSDGTLSPAFSSGTVSFTASVPKGTTSITLTPTAAQPNASITVNGSAVVSGSAASVTLNLGANTITTLVTAQDGTTTKSYTIILMRQTNLAAWRQAFFPGSTAASGPGADTATPQGDGISNLIKFATGLDPTKSGVMPGIAGETGAQLTFTYTPSATAVTDGVTFTVEYNDTLNAGSWASDIVNQGTIGSGGIPVTATVPKGASGTRFLRLKIESP